MSVEAHFTELAADHDLRVAPWSEAALRAAFQRRVRAKTQQAALDRDAGLHRKSPWVVDREAHREAAREIERAVNVENERRREQGQPLVWLAVA